MRSAILAFTLVLTPTIGLSACPEGTSRAELVTFNGTPPLHNFHGPHIKHEAPRNNARYDFRSIGARVELSALTNSEATFIFTSQNEADEYRSLQPGGSASIKYPSATLNVTLDSIDPDATDRKRADWVHVRFEVCK